MSIKRYLDFRTEVQGKKYLIDEIAGSDAVPFALNKEEGRMAIDVQNVGGSDSQFRITPMAQPVLFEWCIMYLELYSQEADVWFGMEINGVDYPLGEIDFANADTDMVSFFSFKVIQKGKQATFKRRMDIPTNVMGYKSIDNKPVIPLVPQKVFAPAKPVTQMSEWRAQNNPIGGNTILTGQDGVFIAPFPQQVKYGIDNSLAPIAVYQYVPLQEAELQTNRDESTLIRAASTLTDVKVDITGINLTKNSIGGTYTTTRIQLSYGNSYQTGEYQTITLFTSTDGTVSLTNASYSATIPVLNNTDKLWIIISITSPAPQGTVSTSVNVAYSGGNLKISTTATTPSSIIRALRVEDIMKKNAEIIADMPVSAPRWAVNGEFQNEWFTTQNLIRGILDRPVNITTKFIVEEYLTGFKGDYQAKENEVFYGREPDFYRDYQSGVFSQVLSNAYRRKTNPKFKINLFKLGYTNFQSQKENETANTQDEVHGNTQIALPSKKLENQVDIKVGVIRSAFSFEIARYNAFKLAFENKETAATQDDDKFYGLDVIPLPPVSILRLQRYTTALQHQSQPNKLVLTNKGDISWVLMGIEIGDPFTITKGANIGSYTVNTVTDQTLTLNSNILVASIPENNTSFSYIIGQSTKLTLRKNEGFDVIQGLSEPNIYPNLRYTVKRLVMKYWQPFLATCMLYNPFDKAKVQEYNNNPDAFTKLTGEPIGIKEGDEFKPVNPILSDVLHEGLQLQMTWEQFKAMEQSVINDRGWIQFTDSRGLPVRGFISNTGDYIINKIDEDIVSGVFTCNIEEMYMPAIVQLSYVDGIFTINGKLTPSDIQFSFDEYQRLSIFDASGKRLTPAVLWNRVRYNGVVPVTKGQLITFLDSIG